MNAIKTNLFISFLFLLFSSQVQAAVCKEALQLNNPAHTSTWVALSKYAGLDKNFPDSACVKIGDLAFLQRSRDTNKEGTLSSLMKEYFEGWLYWEKARIVIDGREIDAQTVMTEAFKHQKDKSVAWLANVIDSLYEFHGE